MHRYFYSFQIRHIILYFVLAIAVFSGLFYSCKPDKIFNEDSGFQLEFSTDTLIYDTIFTTVQSVTKHVKVYNRSDEFIRISDIRLAGGQTSPYRINVNGNPNLSIQNIDLAARDSMYIFVNLILDQNDDSNPLLVEDSILFTTNGNRQKINLVAYGQDAYFYKNVELLGHHIWESDKPHVIMGVVAISDSLSSSLTIREGAKIFLSHYSLLVVEPTASISVLGSLENPVLFLGSRSSSNVEHTFTNPSILEATGQWGHPLAGGIYLMRGSQNNIVSHAIMLYGTGGIFADSLGSDNQPTLTINNSIIGHMSNFGILARESSIKAVNCLIYSCRVHELLLSQGGNYDFRHCTVVNYDNGNVGSLVLNNYYINEESDTIAINLENSFFGNCIFYGVDEEEILFSISSQAQFQYTFENCLVKTTKDIESNGFIACIANQDSIFADIGSYNFKLDSIRSPAYNAGSIQVVNGSSSPFIFNDIIGNSRISDLAPDIGVFEYINR